MLAYLDRFKRALVIIITVMTAAVLVLAVIELGYILVKDLIAPPPFILDIAELLELFGLFLLVLIGIELLETMEIYIKENVVHVEVVFTVALIALARKVIILDFNKVSSPTLMGIGVLILALSIGYYLINRTVRPRKNEDPRK